MKDKLYDYGEFYEVSIDEIFDSETAAAIRKQRSVRTLTFNVYPGPDGKGTCCEDVSDGKICTFLRTVKMGTVDICNYTDEQVSRRNGGLGFTIPTKTCPFWGEKK